MDPSSLQGHSHVTAYKGTTAGIYPAYDEEAMPPWP